MRGAPGAETLLGTLRSQLEIGRVKGRQTILGVCSTQCMLKPVLSLDDCTER